MLLYVIVWCWKQISIGKQTWRWTTQNREVNNESKIDKEAEAKVALESFCCVENSHKPANTDRSLAVSELNTSEEISTKFENLKVLWLTTLLVAIQR